MTEYIHPELLVLIPVLYSIGVGIKKSKLIKDRFIPLILGVIGVILSVLYFVCNGTDVNGLSVFTAITQGVLCASASTYVNQIYKQAGKTE